MVDGPMLSLILYTRCETAESLEGLEVVNVAKSRVAAQPSPGGCESRCVQGLEHTGYSKPRTKTCISLGVFIKFLCLFVIV